MTTIRLPYGIEISVIHCLNATTIGKMVIVQTINELGKHDYHDNIEMLIPAVIHGIN